MKLSEDAQTQCNKCDIWDDVANMKADGHDKFLCIECAYVQLEEENAKLKRENERLKTYASMLMDLSLADTQESE